MCVLFFVFTNFKKNLLEKKIRQNFYPFKKNPRKKPTLSCSGVGSGKEQYSGESSGKNEGEVLSDGWGASIKRKNIRYTKKRGFVS